MKRSYPLRLFLVLAGILWAASWRVIYLEIHRWHHMTPGFRLNPPPSPPGYPPATPGEFLIGVIVISLAMPVVFVVLVIASWRKGRGTAALRAQRAQQIAQCQMQDEPNTFRITIPPLSAFEQEVLGRLKDAAPEPISFSELCQPRTPQNLSYMSRLTGLGLAEQGGLTPGELFLTLTIVGEQVLSQMQE